MFLLKIIKTLAKTLLKYVDSNRLKPAAYIEYPLNKGLPEYFSTDANCTKANVLDIGKPADLNLCKQKSGSFHDAKKCECSLVVAAMKVCPHKGWKASVYFFFNSYSAGLPR